MIHGMLLFQKTLMSEEQNTYFMISGFLLLNMPLFLTVYRHHLKAENGLSLLLSQKALSNFQK